MVAEQAHCPLLPEKTLFTAVRTRATEDGERETPRGRRGRLGIGLAVGAVTVGLVAIASAGHLHKATRRVSAEQLGAYQSLWGSHALRSSSAPSETRASKKHIADYKASVESILADKGKFAHVGRDGKVKHYLPKHEVNAMQSLLHTLPTQGLDEEAQTQGAPAHPHSVPLQEVDFTPPEGFDVHVPVEVYLESQGQASKLFIEWVLVQVVGAPGMTSIINLLMFPWGECSVINKHIERPVNVDVEYIDNYTATNVTLRSGWPAFLCEHGPSECEGNAIMSCVAAIYPDLQQWFRVNACIMARTCADGEAPLVDAVAHTGASEASVCRGMPVQVAPDCINDFGAGMDMEKISSCVKGKQGTELLLQNMVQTQTLVPPIQMLPWILVDQEVLNWPNRSHVFLLGKAICDAYIEKIQPFVNGSVPRPLGCYYFPTEPPYMPPITLWDEQGNTRSATKCSLHLRGGGETETLHVLSLSLSFSHTCKKIVA
jgi:hypothetical protein